MNRIDEFFTYLKSAQFDTTISPFYSQTVIDSQSKYKNSREASHVDVVMLIENYTKAF